MSQILVTGGLGYVGSNISISLLKAGYDVLILDSLINSSIERFKTINYLLSKDQKNKQGKALFRKIDIRNKKLLKDIFNEFEVVDNPIVAVIHCAGLKSVEESVNNPLKYWDQNINSTINLLSIMNTFNCHTLVFSSSATIYKPIKNKKLTEGKPLIPKNAYGNTKLAIELILQDLYKNEPKKWRISNLRYFNPAGSNEEGLLGEDSNLNPTNLFPLIKKVANKELVKLSIFGNDWPTKDGTCIRDYIHIMDLSEAHLATLNFLLKNEPKIISLNIGTGKGFSVLEVVNTFMKINNIKIPFGFEKRRKGDTSYLVACNELARKYIDWKPTRNLEDICLDVLKSSKFIETD